VTIEEANQVSDEEAHNKDENRKLLNEELQ